MSLFRSEVIDAGRRKLMGEVRLAQPPSLLVWTLILSTVALAIGAGLITGTHVRKETVRGYLVPEGGIVNVSATQAGRITRVLVAEGQHVKAGTPLIELSGGSVGAETGQVLSAQINEVERQISSARSRQAASATTLRTDADRIRGQINANLLAATLLQRRRDDKLKLMAMLNDELGRYEGLAAKGYVSQMRVNQQRQQILLQQDDLNALDFQIIALDGQTNELRAQLATKPAAYTDMEASAEIELSSLEQKRIDLSATRHFVERAPIDGIVSNLQAELGQAPAARQPLVSIMPDNSALQAELLVPSRAAGFVSPGDAARLQIDAYPFARFGFVGGKVASVSNSTVNPNEFLAPIEIKESVYRVRVALDQDFVAAYGHRRPLRPGMALTADIVIDRKPLWRQLFDPLLAAAMRSR